MKTLFAFITLLSIVYTVRGQVQPFGVVDTADLRLTSCSFEKDAKAELLFNHCIARFDGHGLVLEHHKRLKIFDAAASSDLGDVSLTQPNSGHIRFISDLEAETINLDNGKIEVIKLDKKSFYKQKIDKWTSRISFTFPAIKNGSIIEYSYKETINYFYRLPDWYFQGKLPERYSEIDLKLPKNYNFRHKFYFTEQVLTNSDSVVAVTNIPSLPEEPYMDTYHGNLQRVSFQMGPATGGTWDKIGSTYVFGGNYGIQLKNKLRNEDELITAVKQLSPEQKIAFLFKKIRDTLTASDEDYYDDNITKVWIRRKGSQDDINIILCRLLEQAGLDANLVVVSNDEDERIYPGDPSARNLDELLAYVKTGGNMYVLDASDKEAKWNEIPYHLLNTYALYINAINPSTGLVFLEDLNKARNVVFINAEISANGTISGTAQITSAGYNRVKTAKKYKEDGEKKFTDELLHDDNNLKISSFRMDNMEIDTLPLIQNINFTYNSPDADDNYLYVDPKLFVSLKANPFLTKGRVSNIDFGYRNNYSINGRYKIPQGYKVSALPKNVSMLMPDSSIRFKQIASEEDGFINIHWLIDYNKSYFPKDEYPSLYDFFRKMFEMLNEQIVLKKA